MRLTSKGRYAVRAMLDLTAQSNGNPVRLQEISARQNISLHYLEQLFRRLRNGQVVKSVRGPGGGYVLARSMDEISIKSSLECVGENINPAKDIIGTEAESANTAEYHLSKDYFLNLGIIMREYLETTTLGDLIRKIHDVRVRLANNTTEPAPATATPEETAAPAAPAFNPPPGEVNQ